MASHQQQFLTVNGCRVRVMRGGQGATMLFLHGAGGASAWTPFMDALSNKFDLIVPEHPGFGGSDVPEWLGGVGDLAYFYLDFINQLGLEDVHLAGNSLGGWIAAETAIRNTAKLKTLTLISPAGLAVPDRPPANIFAWNAEEMARNVVFDATVAATYQRLAAAQPVNIQDKNGAALMLLGREPLLCNPALGTWLHRIDIPTMILWGEQDKVFPAIYGREFAARIPGAELVVIPECGHLPHLEKRDRVVGEIINWTAAHGSMLDQGNAASGGSQELLQEWIRVGTPRDLTDGLHVTNIGSKALIVACLEGEWFAFDRACPHAGAILDNGRISGTTIACRHHSWRFDLRQGGCELRGNQSLRTYPVKLEGGNIYVAT